MKYIKVFCLFSLLFLSSFSVAFAQSSKVTLTPYEKKVKEINVRYFEKFYGRPMSWGDQLQLEQVLSEGGSAEFIMGLALMNFAMNNPKSYVEPIVKKYGAELKAAEKLRGPADIQKEKERKARIEQNKKEKELKAKQEAYAKTDVGSIQISIKSEFEKWNQKGEFEKETDYAERLETKSQTAFNEICINQIQKKINEYNNGYNLKTELSTYNSESEFFTIQFKINDVEWQNKVSIPISQAQSFKNNFSDYDFEINDYDWCFVENNLCPTLVTMVNKDDNFKYNFPLSATNKSEISFAFNDFGIDNQYLNVYIFKYSNAKAIAEELEKEKQRLDMLELTSYNQKLDSIFNNYNKQLLANKYNLDKEKLSDYSKVAGKNDREYNFNRSVSSMQSEFEQLSNSFENKRKNEYRKNGNLFASESEFDNFYTKGKDCYQTEVERKTVLKYLAANSKTIESMDFQQEKKESVGSALGRGLLNISTNSNVSAKDYANENEARKNVLSIINDCKSKTYYSEILDLIIGTNKGLNKEWTKNGKFFTSKAAFYDAYLSEEYKKLLKENKK